MKPAPPPERPPRLTDEEADEFGLWDVNDELVVVIHALKVAQAKLRIISTRTDTRNAAKRKKT